MQADGKLCASPPDALDQLWNESLREQVRCMYCDPAGKAEVARFAKSVLVLVMRQVPESSDLSVGVLRSTVTL